MPLLRANSEPQGQRFAGLADTPRLHHRSRTTPQNDRVNWQPIGCEDLRHEEQADHDENEKLPADVMKLHGRDTPSKSPFNGTKSKEVKPVRHRSLQRPLRIHTGWLLWAISRSVVGDGRLHPLHLECVAVNHS